MFSMPIRIHRCRSAASLSQASLASQVGVCRSAVAQWERTGGTCPSVEHLAKVAVATGVQFEWLATGRGPMRLQPADHDGHEAALMRDFTRDALEDRVLGSLRRLSGSRRALACRLLETLAD